MKRLLLAVTAVVLLLFVALLAIPFFVSEQTIKEQIAAQLETSAGWTLRADGPISVSAVPTLRFSARDVGLSGAAGADGVEFASAREIRFGLALVPLLTGKVRVTDVTLVAPNIFLERDAQGRTSWDPRRPDEAAPGAAPGPDATVGEAGETDPAAAAETALARLQFGAVTIENGLIVWDDRQADQLLSVKNINITLNMPDIGSALEAEGSVGWKDMTVAFETTVEKPLALAEGGESPIALHLETDDSEASLAGVFSQGPAPAFAGTVEASTPALLPLLASAGFPLDGMAGLEDIALQARVDYGADRAALDDLKLGFDGNTLSGRLAVRLDGDRPAITGGLTLDRINVDLYRGDKEKASKAKKTKAAEAENTATPIDLSSLRALDADVSLRIDTIEGGDVPLSGVSARALVKAGRLDLTLDKTRLLGGAVALALTADGSGKVPAFSGRLRSAGLSLKELAAIAGEARPIRGTLATDLAFSTRGGTLVAVSDALTLSGSAKIRDGLLGGLDLADVVGGAKDANRVSNVALDVAIAGFGDPVKLSGGLVWHGEKFTLAGEATPAALAAGTPSPVSVDLKSSRMTVGFTGKASAKGRLDGRVRIATPNLRRLAVWLGQPMPDGKGLKDFSFDGELKVTGRAVAFSKATVSLDGTKGTGGGRFVFAGKTPQVKANLALDVLTLDPYLGGEAATAGEGAARRGGKGGWSREPIDLSALRAIDADLTLSTKGIRWDELKIGASKLKVALKGGRLDAELQRLKLYRGTGTGKVVLDGSGKVPSVDASFDLKNVAVFPLLRDAVAFDWIEGTGRVALDVKARGASQFDLVSALQGTASLDFRNGAVRGINVAKLLRGLSVDVLLGWQENKREKTDFSVFKAAFKIDKGIARTETFRMVGPLVRVNGDGTTDLPGQRLDWRVNPKIVPALQGQRARKAGNKKADKAAAKSGKLVGLSVPVIIEGPWADPKIYPDIKGILSNPQAAYKQLQSLGGNLLGGDVLGGDAGKAVDKLLGSKNAAEAVGSILGGNNRNGNNRQNGRNQNGNQNRGVEKLIDGLLGQ